jgi:acyl phosphate:glycerol-3-phosphate acyltransferase
LVTTLIWILLIAGSYLAGSIPFGWLTAKWIAGVDLREVGSGNIGATNATRVLGKTWGSIVLLLDALKGLLPTAVWPWLLGVSPEFAKHAMVLCGLVAILGHLYPIWLRFRGGKGVATAAGVVAVLAPIGTLVALAIFLGIYLTTRIVSLGSLAAAIAFAVYQLIALQPQPFGSETWSIALFSVVVPLLIVVRHRSNILRLWRREEPGLQTDSAAMLPSQPLPASTTSNNTPPPRSPDA